MQEKELLDNMKSAGIWGKQAHLALEAKGDASKIESEMRKLMPKYDEFLKIQKFYSAKIDEYKTLVDDVAFPTKEDAKGLHRSKDSIEKKISELSQISYKNRVSVQKLAEQIDKFNVKAIAAIKDNKVEPVMMEGIQLKKNLGMWRESLKTSANMAYDDISIGMLENAEKALVEHQPYDAGPILKKIKSVSSKPKKVRASKPKIICSKCKTATKDPIGPDTVCFDCFKTEFNRRLKILRAKEGNYTGDAEQYSNISLELEEGLAKYLKSRKTIDAVSLIPTLETCERIMQDVEYLEQDLSSDSADHDDDEMVESSSEASNYDSEDAEEYFSDDEEDSIPIRILDFISQKDVSSLKRDRILELYRDQRFDDIEEEIQTDLPVKKRAKTITTEEQED